LVATARKPIWRNADVEEDSMLRASCDRDTLGLQDMWSAHGRLAVWA
jgi:hypothetical protein